MKTFIVSLLFIFKTILLFGQYYIEDYSDKTLINLKNTLEQSLAGTKIRTYHSSFTIDRDKKTNQYVFSGNVVPMLSQNKIKKINHHLNKILQRKKNIKLNGTTHFDSLLDSCLISIGYTQDDDIIYDFISIPRHLHPAGGFEKFSNELHDVIKHKINQNKILRDSLSSNNNFNYIEFVVDKSGAITDVNRQYIGKELDSFFKAKRWNSIMSGFPINLKAEFVLFKEYLLDNGQWPHRFDNVQNSTDNENAWAVLDFIAPYKMGTQTTYFSSSLPKREWRYHSIVSMVYDSGLKKYRMPIVHFGTLSDTNQLIRDVDNSTQRYWGYGYDRIYFYRMN